VRLLNRFGAVPLLLIAMGAGPTLANPANRAALATHFGDLMAADLQSCLLCHVGEHGEGASSLDEFPHNAFGDAMRIAGEQLLDAGKDDAMSERMQLLAAADADGDGITNLLEILLGSHPGDPNHVPSQSDLDRSAELLSAYQSRLLRYRWRPFERVQRPAVPDGVTNTSGTMWSRGPIDDFIAQQRDQAGLRAQGEAKAEQLLRRVYLDLVGLSPTPEEISTFQSQSAQDPKAYERVVDALLQHPGYGERWGRHWMDVWRYSDWAGYKDALRESQRHIWHWRDWIVESLNEDKGYDVMVMQMLAADEMQVDASELRATGFLARNFHTTRDQWMDDLVKHTSQALLGITLGCAKCHDHMTDPIEQSEYYGLRAVFETHHVNTDRVPGQLDISLNGIPRVYDRSLDAKTYLFLQGDERYPDKTQPIAPGIPAALGGALQITPVSRDYEAAHPDQRTFVREALLQQVERKIAAASSDEVRRVAESERQALQAEFELEGLERKGLDAKSPRWREVAQEIARLQRAPEKTDGEMSADEKPESPSEKGSEFKRREQFTYPEHSSGRRLAFAHWLTDRDNPLAARVAVNHIWMRHFGRAIVPTVNDFGYGGREPTHPALLDWLAAELMDNHWSMKWIHRLIVTSATYRMASTIDSDAQAIDPDNQLHWRGPIRRMEGEVVRDNLLSIAGRLDAAMGGPDIDQTQAEASNRRSIYLRHAHEKLVEFVQIFDGPAVSECYVRETSIQPHQALALANSSLTVEAAKAIDRELADSVGDDEQAFVQQAFRRVLGRSSLPQEQQACLEFLRDGVQTRRNLIIVLFNHNDFVSIR